MRIKVAGNSIIKRFKQTHKLFLKHIYAIYAIWVFSKRKMYVFQIKKLLYYPVDEL